MSTPNTSIDKRSQKNIDEEDVFLELCHQITKPDAFKSPRFSDFIKSFADDKTPIGFLNNGFEFISCGKVYQLKIVQVKLKTKNHEHKRSRKA